MGLRKRGGSHEEPQEFGRNGTKKLGFSKWSLHKCGVNTAMCRGV